MKPLKDIFDEQFLTSFKYYSTPKSKRSPLTKNTPMPDSTPISQSAVTPTTSSLSNDIKAVETYVVKEAETLAADLTYDVSTAFTHIKAEITKLESFVESKTTTINSNNDKIKALNDENTKHTSDVSAATDTISKLKPIVGL